MGVYLRLINAINAFQLFGLTKNAHNRLRLNNLWWLECKPCLLRHVKKRADCNTCLPGLNATGELPVCLCRFISGVELADLMEVLPPCLAIL